METKKLLFLMLLTLATSAFVYMIAKKTDHTGKQRISVEKFSQWQKKNGPEIIQLRNYIRQKAPSTRSFTADQLDKQIQKTIKAWKKTISPTISNIACRIHKS